jgi:hypothetical protein
MRTPLIAVTFALVGLSCAESDQTGGIDTVVDASSDTIVARVDGAVPAEALKRLEVDMRIAPGADDTALFGQVQDFVVDQRGFVWAYDHTAHTIFLFDRAGKLMRRVGRRGAGPGEFQRYAGMAVLSDGRLAVRDGSNARLSFFSPAGDFLTSWSMKWGDALVTDASGALYALETIFPPEAAGVPAWAGDAPASLVRVNDGGAIGDTLHPPRLQRARRTGPAHCGSGTRMDSSSAATAAMATS